MISSEEIIRLTSSDSILLHRAHWENRSTGLRPSEKVADDRLHKSRVYPMNPVNHERGDTFYVIVDTISVPVAQRRRVFFAASFCCITSESELFVSPRERREGGANIDPHSEINFRRSQRSQIFLSQLARLMK